MTGQDVAFVNGVFSDLASASISINDRGFLFGDGVYEVIRTVAGEPLYLDEHLTRLAESTNALGFTQGPWLRSLPEIIRQGLSRSNHPESLIYIQITRGIQLRNHVPDVDMTPSVIITFRAFTELAGNFQQAGVAVRTFPDLRHHLCQWKTTNLLAHTLAKTEARREGFFEAVFVRDGFIGEGSSSSLFLVIEGKLHTPRVGHSVLPGVTRDHVLHDFAKRVEIEAVERDIPVDELTKASEVFLATTSYFILPVVRIDNQQINQGRPGQITQRLIDSYNQFLNQRRSANLTVTHSSAQPVASSHAG